MHANIRDTDDSNGPTEAKRARTPVKEIRNPPRAIGLRPVIVDSSICVLGDSYGFDMASASGCIVDNVLQIQATIGSPPCHITTRFTGPEELTWISKSTPDEGSGATDCYTAISTQTKTQLEDANRERSFE